MNEKKIVVPEGMLKAVMEYHDEDFPRFTMDQLVRLRGDLEAALLWLSENPIVPSKEQVIRIAGQDISGGQMITKVDEKMILFIQHWISSWQCCMFRAPKPEVPCAHVRTNSYHNFRNAQECVIGGKSNLPVIVCLDCGQIIDGRA